MKMEFKEIDGTMMGFKTECIELEKGGEMTIGYGQRKWRYMLMKFMFWWVSEVLHQGRGR